MLPATFDSDARLRVSKLGIGIFAVAVLTAGFCLTILLTFAVRNPIFQADSVYLPALTSCALGLLTIFYDFIISPRYVWNTPALLSIVAASVSTLTYAGLLIWTYRKIHSVRARGPPILSQQQPEELSRETSHSHSNSRWQDPAYYENYIQNMFPASARSQQQPAGYDPNSITEEEMQRQQMLMLLLHRDQGPSPDATQSTFRIDWQGQEPDELPPGGGYYAPHPHSASTTNSSAYPLTAVSANWPSPQQLRPWDGVWRSPAPVSVSAPGRGRGPGAQYHSRDQSREWREERRREIEMGR